MAILSINDVERLAPDIQMDESLLLSAIASTQALIESHLCLDRPIEIKETSEVKNLPTNGRFYVSRMPIVLSPTPQIKVRGAVARAFGFGLTSTAWRTISSGDFDVDTINGEIAIKPLTLGGSVFGSSDSRVNRRPTKRASRSQVQITYTSGLDFSLSTPDIEALKVAAVSILRIKQSQSYAGIKKYALEGFYEVEYQTPPDVGAETLTPQIREQLAVFSNYKTRAFAI